jgi:nucleoid-associated protein YgaU
MPDPAQFTFYDEKGKVSETFPVLYNPTEYTLNKQVQLGEHVIPGLDSPVIQFVRGQAETLSFDLFFDSSDERENGAAKPVTVYTDKFARLVRMRGDLHAPPVCEFSWGGSGFPGSHLGTGIESQQRTSFKCVVESVRQKFTFFDATGVPLRAILTIALREYKTLLEQLRQLHLLSSDHTHVHTVRQGDTLASIAADVYGDPSEWRRLAEHNGVTDPLALRPGALLEIAPLEAPT